jgi:hypothetical protein
VVPDVTATGDVFICTRRTPRCGLVNQPGSGAARVRDESGCRPRPPGRLKLR